MGENGNSARVWNELARKLEPLRAKARANKVDARDVAARPG